MTPAGKTHAPVHAAEKDTMSPHDRYLLFMKALDGVREDKGTPYPCTQKDLDGYVKHYRHNSDARYLTAAEATNELCNWLNHFNEPDASSMAALERLRKGIQLKPWGPDLVIKAFKDLDIAFFKGTLLGNVRVGWEDMGYYLLGLTSPVRHAQCRIILNPRSILLSPLNGQIPFREMWRTMLHEMCVSRKNVLAYRSQPSRDPLRISRRRCKTRRSQLTYENLPS